MIKSEQYKKEGNITYVTMDMVKACHTKREVRRFREWYNGQTSILCKNETLGIYAYDYRKWVESGMLSSQGVDWD